MNIDGMYHQVNAVQAVVNIKGQKMLGINRIGQGATLFCTRIKEIGCCVSSALTLLLIKIALQYVNEIDIKEHPTMGQIMTMSICCIT